MTRRFAGALLAAAALCTACGGRADRMGAPEQSGTTVAYPPFTLPSTTLAAPVPDAMTLVLSADTGFQPYSLTRQNVEFTATLSPGVALRNSAGVLLRAWIEARDGSEQLNKGFSPIGSSGAQVANIEVSDSQYVQVAISGDFTTTSKTAAEVPLAAVGDIPIDSLDALSNAFGPSWVEVARLERNSRPLGDSWATSYTNRAGEGIKTVVYALTEPGGIELASLVFSYDLTAVGNTPVVYRSEGGGVPPAIWFLDGSGLLVLMSADAKQPGDLERLVGAFSPISLKDLQASLVTV